MENKPQIALNNPEDNFYKKKLSDILSTPQTIETSNYLNDNFEKFEDIDHDIAIKLIELGYGDLIPDKLNYIKNANQKEIINMLFEKGVGDSIAFSIYNFKEEYHKEIMDKLLELKNGDAGNAICSNIDEFKDLNQTHSDIILKLLEVDCGNEEDIIKNLDLFKLSPKELYTKSKDIFPDIILEIESKFPKFSDQLSKSPELLLDILIIRKDFKQLEIEINKNPFLLDALEKNPRYASLLIFKYRELDQESKSNIKELFINKSVILENNPDIDPRSSEFRKLMQNNLVNYKNNQQILVEMENRGVNVYNWQNYEESVGFSLGEEEGVKFTKKITKPVTRTLETLDLYKNTTFNALSEYKLEFQIFFVLNNEAEELKAKINELEERIKNTDDVGKLTGMKKGLAGLKTKIESIKPAPLWDRIQGEMFRFKSMIENVSKFHNLCMANELAIENAKEQKELIIEKNNLDENRLQLHNKLKELDVFFESFNSKLEESTVLSLGDTRAKTLIMDIKERMNEGLIHYQNDKNTLNEVFNEKKFIHKLEGRELEISIASRDPDRDLYLGNYCPCCISIDSDHNGSESPISDYVTDLGMQNIVVYDKKRNIPVVACWAFIGEDDTNGDPILVIDNIESNTEYTNDYPQKIKEVITKFIEDYAKSSNLKHIVQGPHNNDLEAFPLRRVKRKLGGLYNRDGGYFLEAEKG